MSEQPYEEQNETGTKAKEVPGAGSEKTAAPAPSLTKRILTSRVTAIAAALGIAAGTVYNCAPRAFSDRFGISTVDDQISAGCMRSSNVRYVTGEGGKLVEAALSRPEQEKLFALEKRFLCGERDGILAERDKILNPRGLNGAWLVNVDELDPDSDPGTHADIRYNFTYTEKR